MENFELTDFELYVHRRHIARLLARYELLKKVINKEGSIIECGVHNGGGLMAWAKMSEIFEPYAIRKKVFGFDTFEGFPEIKDQDIKSNPNKPNKGEFKTHSMEAIETSIELFENSRYLKQFKKIELIKGDAKRQVLEQQNESNVKQPLPIHYLLKQTVCPVAVYWSAS